MVSGSAADHTIPRAYTFLRILYQTSVQTVGVVSCMLDDALDRAMPQIRRSATHGSLAGFDSWKIPPCRWVHVDRDV